jgi:hypothetical protein
VHRGLGDADDGPRAIVRAASMPGSSKQATT